MYKKVAVASFEVLFCHLFIGTDSLEKLQSITSLPTNIFICDLRTTKQEWRSFYQVRVDFWQTMVSVKHQKHVPYSVVYMIPKY